MSRHGGCGWRGQQGSCRSSTCRPSRQGWHRRLLLRAVSADGQWQLSGSNAPGLGVRGALPPAHLAKLALPRAVPSQDASAHACCPACRKRPARQIPIPGAAWPAPAHRSSGSGSSSGRRPGQTCSACTCTRRRGQSSRGREKVRWRARMAPGLAGMLTLCLLRPSFPTATGACVCARGGRWHARGC